MTDPPASSIFDPAILTRIEAFPGSLQISGCGETHSHAQRGRVGEPNSVWVGANHLAKVCLASRNKRGRPPPKFKKKETTFRGATHINRVYLVKRRMGLLLLFVALCALSMMARFFVGSVAQLFLQTAPPTFEDGDPGDKADKRWGVLATRLGGREGLRV